ncbi:MAG: hypothetical protein ACTHLR_08685 [Rhizomicrobium sp.]
MNALRSARGKWPDVAPEPEDEAEHFYICKACGQAVDRRRLGDVFHHEEAGHAPIPVD